MATVYGPSQPELTEIPQQSWRREDSIDEGHVSPQGNAAFARLIAARISKWRWVTGLPKRHRES